MSSPNEAINERSPLLAPQQTNQDQDVEANASIPFPSQRDPRRPLRPSDFTRQRVASKWNSWFNKNRGLLLVLLAQLFYSTMALFYKLLNSLPPSDGQVIGPLEIVFVRMGITYIGCLFFLLVTKTPHPFLGPPGVRLLLVLRGVVGFGGLSALYYSLQYLSLADATVITFLAPLVTGIFGYVFLKERFSHQEALAGLISICGVFLIARPKFLFGKHSKPDLDVPVEEESFSSQLNSFNSSTVSTGSWLAKRVAEGMVQLIAPDQISNTYSWDQVGTQNITNPQSHDGAKEPKGVTEEQRIVAVVVSLLGVVCAAGAYTTIRAIGKRASPLHSVAFFALYSTVVSGALMWYLEEAFVIPSGGMWLSLLFLVGLFGLLAQTLMTYGLQLETAGRATTAVYSQVIYSTVFQLLVLKVPVHPLSAIGCALILSAAVYVTFSK